MLCCCADDRYFYDPTTHKYTVQKWLDDINKRYGGVDSILMWPTYTNIGADDRSQFDLFEAMPGGLPGVRAAVDELHAAGVKVLIPYNPWDSGTLRCGPGMATCGGDPSATADGAKGKCGGPATSKNPGVCDARIIDGLLKEMNADGFNGDTMGNIPSEFYTVSKHNNHSVAMEPEGGGGGVREGQSTANWDTMGWGYWKYNPTPQVDTWKWLDSRRMTNVCERWAQDHTHAIQGAWFNGVGFETWENVWGTWNGITEKDGEQARRVRTMMRFLGSRGYTSSQSWLPHSGTAYPDALYASYWPLEGSAGKVSSAAWTVVGRGTSQFTTYPTAPTLSNIPTPPAGTKWYYYDLWAGIELDVKNLTLMVEKDGAFSIEES